MKTPPEPLSRADREALKAVYRLTKGGEGAHTGGLAESLGVTPGTVTEPGLLPELLDGEDAESRAASSARESAAYASVHALFSTASRPCW